MILQANLQAKFRYFKQFKESQKSAIFL